MSLRESLLHEKRSVLYSLCVRQQLAASAYIAKEDTLPPRRTWSSKSCFWGPRLRLVCWHTSRSIKVASEQNYCATAKSVADCPITAFASLLKYPFGKHPSSVINARISAPCVRYGYTRGLKHPLLGVRLRSASVRTPVTRRQAVADNHRHSRAAHKSRRCGEAGDLVVIPSAPSVPRSPLPRRHGADTSVSLAHFIKPAVRGGRLLIRELEAVSGGCKWWINGDRVRVL